MISAMKNIALPITFASGGIPRADETQTNLGERKYYTIGRQY